MSYISNIQFYKSAFERGENITQLLKSAFGSNHNTQTIIETAYDLQAGSYLTSIPDRQDFVHSYIEAQYSYLNSHTSNVKTLLDIGTGELTCILPLIQRLNEDVQVFAFDISWSRLFKGREHYKKQISALKHKPRLFCADIGRIPLPDNSIDVVISSHALEPNHGREKELLAEILRVAKETILLFEPSYELADISGKKRMQMHGYVRGLPETAKHLGATVQLLEKMPIVDNPLNPTAVLVLKKQNSGLTESPIWVDPVNYQPLINKESYYYCQNSGVSFPIIEGIPMLREQNAILTTALG